MFLYLFYVVLANFERFHYEVMVIDYVQGLIQALDLISPFKYLTILTYICFH